ncbi:CAMK/CAMKL/MARK protein kinase [Ephemerocybe angulata]|uniref:CAMK/CAMKL/MARK protein kinase n=1 Tax=Ephemerocybe angulata TaxID=980116 RepID=A0A8H6HUB2_9AGAR|nr:CAMK/CAMKL/MARK protein kinase [Tulosesus angulatus]
MPSAHGHKQSDSVHQNRKAQLANAYNELGKELSSSKIRVVGNYTLGKVIGEGAYGKVRLGTHRLTSTRVAIKQIPKAMSASLTREIHHHRQLHHPHVTQMFEVIATESSIWIVTELCSGGELFDYLVEKERLPEDETKIIFGQLCLAVAYLHDNGIVHRDLKLENVLLDERCRVKLGDFGFTREYERGSYMETFCGTTGYASPEMLQGRKYQGPEVDVWSLGIILYCLLTGTLPFDDDDEDVMRQKIIKEDFEDPAWLSLEARDLLLNVLQKDVAKRYTIPQILAHSWFTAKELTYEPDSPLSLNPVYLQIPRSSSPDNASEQRDRSDSQSTAPESSEASTQDHGSPFSKDHHIESSTPTTPDDSIIDPFDSSPHPDHKDSSNFLIHRNTSNSTIRRTSLSDIESLSSRLTKQPETVLEEEIPESKSAPLRPVSWSNSSGSKAPPSKIRTPARTKRRNILGEFDKSPTPLPPSTYQLDFASLLITPTPIIFSSPLERELLNTLSNLGMDTAQIVHSVLSDACDSAGALWWMLKKKAEKKAAEEGTVLGLEQVSSPITETVPIARTSSDRAEGGASGSAEPSKRKRVKANAGVQTDGQAQYAQVSFATPQLAFVPPTPTFIRPVTPPRTTSPNRSPLLSPTSSIMNSDSASRSHPSTPGGSGGKEKDGSKGRKARAGSVSIMQRATTALEAAGLVRKKSAEAVLRDEQRSRERDLERRGTTSGEESRSSHSHETKHSHSGGAIPAGNSGNATNPSSKLTKSPPLKAQKDARDAYGVPSTPPPSEREHSSGANSGVNGVPVNAATIGSPWVLADPREAPAGGMLHSHSAPNLDTLQMTPTSSGNRANILTSLRLWFNDDRKGKRKADASRDWAGKTPQTPQTGYSGRSMGFGGSGTAKRRGSNSSTRGGRAVMTNAATTGHHRAKRPSMSSRRSSSVNSRRSSVASMQQITGSAVLDSPSQGLGLRTVGSHTPNSERGEYTGGIDSSRPSSHRKSPSASSSGSLHLRTASPMQRHHRRAGSASSGTRVVRQSVARPPHARSNSATSSLYSPPSSRPTSFYEPSESEGLGLAGSYGSTGAGSAREGRASPFRSRKRGRLRHSWQQKRSGPLASPAFGGGTLGKSSWKKAWGMEPPGWQNRSTLLPAVEVLTLGPPVGPDPPMLRDVFSNGGRGSFSGSAGDESDWVDEDDLDIPAFAGGLGQMGVMSGGAAAGVGGVGSSGIGSLFGGMEPIVTLSPAPRGHRGVVGTGGGSKKNGGAGAGVMGAAGARGKQGHSPAERQAPLPPLDTGSMASEGRATGRRQLPPGRAGPAFKHPIQEEDEDEEEE